MIGIYSVSSTLAALLSFGGVVDADVGPYDTWQEIGLQMMNMKIMFCCYYNIFVA